MQHVIVTADAKGNITCSPDPIQIYRDDQFIRLSPGANTSWGTPENPNAPPIILGGGWPGGEAHLDVNNTCVADANNPLAPNAQMVTYSVTFLAFHTETLLGGRHDPPIENQPEP